MPLPVFIQKIIYRWLPDIKEANERNVNAWRQQALAADERATKQRKEHAEIQRNLKTEYEHKYQEVIDGINDDGFWIHASLRRSILRDIAYGPQYETKLKYLYEGIKYGVNKADENSLKAIKDLEVSGLYSLSFDELYQHFVREITNHVKVEARHNIYNEGRNITVSLAVRPFVTHVSVAADTHNNFW